MSKFIYWTKEGKFKAVEYYDDIPWCDLQSPNDETPALIYPTGKKVWFYEGLEHRLTGPAIIGADGKEEFWLNGINYKFKDWLIIHPNQDISFQTKMKLQYT